MFSESCNLKTLLCDPERTLSLPRFQRTYKWPKQSSKPDDVQRLFDDIVSNISRSGIDSKFVGSVILLDPMLGISVKGLREGTYVEKDGNIAKLTKSILQDFCSTHGAENWNTRSSKSDLIEALLQTRLEKTAKIIDAQQRLTTLSLMAIAIHHISKQNDFFGGTARYQARRREIRKICKRIYLNYENNLRLNLHSTDDRNLLDYSRDNVILTRNSRGPRYSCDSRGAGPRNRVKMGIHKITRNIFKMMDEEETFTKKVGILEILIDWIYEKTSMVMVVVENEIQAHLVFQSLNSRGEPLVLAELVNSLLQLKASELASPGSSIEEQTSTSISNIETILENDERAIEGDFYYRYHLMNIGWGSLKDGEILTGIQKRIEEVQTVTDFLSLLDDFKEQAEYYNKCVKSTIQDSPDSLKDINAIIDQHVPLFMAIQKMNLNTAQRNRAIKLIETFVVRYFIVGSGKPPDKDWSEWCQLIMNHGNDAFWGTIPGNENISTQISRLIKFKSAHNKTNIEARLKDNPLNKNEAKLLLRKILDVSFDSDYNTENFQTEHIAPTNHTNWPAANWQNSHVDKEITRIKNLLGNFLILTKAENNNISDRSWLQRRKLYLKSEMTHVREFANEHINTNPWKPSHIKERTEELSKKVHGIWKMPENIT